MSEDVASGLPSPSSNPNSNATPIHSPSSLPDTPRSSFSRPGSSRVNNPALVPLSTSNNTTHRNVAIATASPTRVDYANPSPMGGGPTSTSYVVPPRPKPGRKPATDEPASKRKAQNRESQRAFRARKAAKLTEMQTQVETTEQKFKNELTEKDAQLAEREKHIIELNARLKRLEEINLDYRERSYHLDKEQRHWKKRASVAEAALSRYDEVGVLKGWDPAHKLAALQAQARQDSPARESAATYTSLATTPQSYGTPSANDIGCGNCKADGPCACITEIATMGDSTPFMAAVPLSNAPSRAGFTPMNGVQRHDTPDVFAEREIDFTTQYANTRLQLDNRPSVTFLNHGNEEGIRCGFCTDDSNCMCKESRERAQDDAAASVASPTEMKRVTTAPGTCDDCMRDPKQKAWCKRVAELKSSAATDYFSPRARSRVSSIGSLDPMEPRTDYAPVQHDPNRSIGCSDAYKLFDGRVNMDQEATDWSTLRPMCPDSTRENLPGIASQRTYSALELDTAGVIATLQQTINPITARAEDGAHADIIRIAQEHQRSSNSPRVSTEGASPAMVSPTLPLPTPRRSLSRR